MFVLSLSLLYEKENDNYYSNHNGVLVSCFIISPTQIYTRDGGYEEGAI
jgi:hypothetical protein